VTGEPGRGGGFYRAFSPSAKKVVEIRLVARPVARERLAVRAQVVVSGEHLLTLAHPLTSQRRATLALDLAGLAVGALRAQITVSSFRIIGMAPPRVAVWAR
jgi:hypothetical protein